jgi:hypothetical protein
MDCGECTLVATKERPEWTVVSENCAPDCECPSSGEAVRLATHLLRSFPLKEGEQCTLTVPCQGSGQGGGQGGEGLVRTATIEVPGGVAVMTRHRVRPS